jgi:hypothetical protein
VRGVRRKFIALLWGVTVIKSWANSSVLITGIPLYRQRAGIVVMIDHS